MNVVVDLDQEPTLPSCNPCIFVPSSFCTSVLQSLSACEAIPNLCLEAFEVHFLIQTNSCTFFSSDCFYSGFFLLHFQQSTKEAEISLPYLTPKTERNKLRVFNSTEKTEQMCYSYLWCITTVLTYLHIIKTCLKIEKRQMSGRKLMTKTFIEVSWNCP